MRHIVSTFGRDFDDEHDRAAEQALEAVDPDNVWIGTSYDLDRPHHRNDYLVEADTADLHGRLRQQEERYMITRLEDR